MRARQARNFLTTLLLSQGVPMLLGGDEIGRTQQGNNNAYNHDNDVSWFDWERAAAWADLERFCAELLALHHRHPCLSQARWWGADLRFHGAETDGKPWYTVTGGRIPNPWLSTNLVYDEDLRFEGVAGTYRPGFAGLDQHRNLSFTFGAFPLEEVELSSQDKWLLGSQVGGELHFGGGAKLSLGLAYYDYVNTVASERAAEQSTRLHGARLRAAWQHDVRHP
jgi:hypothetical protein